MAFTIVQSNIGTHTTTGTATAALSGVSASNQLLAFVFSSSTSAYSLSSFLDSVDPLTAMLSFGTQLVNASVYLGTGVYLDSAPTAGAHTVTATFSAAVNASVFLAEVNAGGTLSLDVAGTLANGHSTAFATNSITSTQDGDVVIAAGPIANSTETLSGWGSFTQEQFYNGASPSGVWAYYVQPTHGAVSASATISATSNWLAGIVALKVTAAGSAPTVTSVNAGANIAEGATAVPVVGTNFDNTVTVNILQPGGVSVAQTGVVYNSSTSLSFNLVVEPGSGDQLAFTDSTYTTNLEATTTTGGTSAPFAITVSPPTGLIFQTLASINPTGAYDITAIPGLAAGDQLEASGNSAGTAAAPSGLTLGNDATFYFTAGNTPVNFWVRAYDGTNKVWGNWALQNVEGIMAFYFLSMGVIPLSGAQY